VIDQIIRRQSLCAALLLAVAVDLYPQVPITVPAGLPDWAFNIPDKVQPASVRPEGVVRAQGSRKEYDASKIAGNSNPQTGFPKSTGLRRNLLSAAQGSPWLAAHAILCRDKGIPNRPIWLVCRLNI
jgi:hypothetical protein